MEEEEESLLREKYCYIAYTKGLHANFLYISPCFKKQGIKVLLLKYQEIEDSQEGLDQSLTALTLLKKVVNVQWYVLVKAAEMFYTYLGCHCMVKYTSSLLHNYHGTSQIKLARSILTLTAITPSFCYICRCPLRYRSPKSTLCPWALQDEASYGGQKWRTSQMSSLIQIPLKNHHLCLSLY